MNVNNSKMKIIKAVKCRFNKMLVFASVVCILPVSCHEKQNDMIYILEWTKTYFGPDWPFRDLEMGQEAFTSKNCSFQNCFITSNHSYFNNVLDYDAVVINAVHYTRFPEQNLQLPLIRSEIQQYILLSVEPAAYNPVPDNLNGKINLTWTYKLNSDIIHPYFTVRNKYNEILGPKLDMHWININDLPPVNSSIIQKLKNKHLAAAWVGSNCYSKDRISYIVRLKNELQSKYGLQLDMFGTCGNDATCMKIIGERNGLLTKCYKRIELDYYFYLAFENSFSEDYVSEKVLHGLHHYAVPIVFGGANYTRFLPKGIYLDATKLGVKELAKEMYDIINDPPRYYDFFRWHGYYSFHDSGDDKYRNTVCELCAFLNREKRKRTRTFNGYENIVDWWNVPAPDDFPNIYSFLYDFVAEEPQKKPPESTSLISRILDILD